MEEGIIMKLGLPHRANGFHSPRDWPSLLADIDQRGEALKGQTQETLRKQGLALRYRAQSGESLDDLLPESFALVREAAERHLGMRHYDVQLIGGLVMHGGGIAEMQTGEGKTLTATLPATLAGFLGPGTHLATANDYLAQRDAEMMAPVYHALGLKVGAIHSRSTPIERQAAYACDVTYGTAKEFGFDFLRHRLEHRDREEWQGKLSKPNQVAAKRRFALVDEADALLIDEARTPLVVSGMPGKCPDEVTRVYAWAESLSHQMTEHEEYQWSEAGTAVQLTTAGRRRVRASHHSNGAPDTPLLDLYFHLENALLVHHRYLRDRHYVVRDEEIVIVDEFTGRLSEGRCWRGGIHQAIQAKEGLPLTPDSGQAARVTMQNFFLQYDRLAGMTGTANHSEKEMSRIYRMKVQPIPTNRSPKRELLPDRIFSDQDQKWLAIAAEVRAIHETGQPVLVGTRSIDKSELLSRHLQSMGVEHQVLNASQELAEAEVIAKAGQKGQVTVATNMAGRGTDIRLGDGVESLGGLYVIGTELHEAQRIDRQLMGRCGRQGDPGVFRQYLALDDDILRQGLGDRLANRWIETGRHHEGELHQSPRIFFRAQRKIEKRHFRQRRALMEREQQKQFMHEQMGQDPFLDAPE